MLGVFPAKVSLPVLSSVCSAHLIPKEAAERVHLFIVQHILDDTEHFLHLVDKIGFESITIVAIPYSSQREIIARLETVGLHVLVPDNDQIGATIENEIRAIFKKCHQSGSKLAILEIGGRCANVVDSIPDDFERFCLGIVEDTTFGRRIYERIEPNLRIPVLHVADSQLKDLEATFVGEAVAEQVQVELKKLGRRMAGIKAAVLGYGPIGESVAHAMRRRLGHVSIYDIDAIQTVRGAMAGFNVTDRRQTLCSMDLIIGATGHASLGPDDLGMLQDGVILCSASSGQVELPMQSIESLSLTRRENVGLSVEYILETGRKVIVLGDGYPINFNAGSVPVEVIDLVHSEIYLCLKKILTESVSPGLFAVGNDIERVVATEWTKLSIG